jgi:hypothetical protein
MRSTIGEFILWMHNKALDEGKIHIPTDPDEGWWEGLKIVAALTVGKGHSVGVELYRGKPDSPLARQILRRAMARLGNLDRLIAYIDDNGYTTIALRALLSNHWSNLQAAKLDTDANAIYMDVTAAVKRVSAETRYICAMLVAGMGPKEVGQKFNVNGSRRISRACLDLVAQLEPRGA